MRLLSLALVAITAGGVLAHTAAPDQERIAADVQALTANGPCPGGSSANLRARNYLADQLRDAGYQVEVQSFDYRNPRPGAARLQAGILRADGLALTGSRAARLQAPVSVVEGSGTPEDFARAHARGTIALLRRAPATALDDLIGITAVRNAEAAGARAIVLITTEPWARAIGAKEYRADAPAPTTPTAPDATIPGLSLNENDGERLIALAERERVSAVLSVEQVPTVLPAANLIAHLPGVTSPSVLVGAHYDSFRTSPGAEDNASGAAALLEIARLAAGTPLAGTAWFVAFDAEEDGLLGSKAFLARTPTGALATVHGMLNLDMVGTQPDGTVLFIPQSQVASAWAGSAPELQALPVGAAYASDQLTFRDAGIDAAVITTRYNPNLHTSSDTTTDPALIAKAVHGALAVATKIAAP